MQLEIIILSEVSQKEKRQVPYDIPYMWNLTYSTQMNLSTKQKQTQRQNRLVRCQGSMGGRGMDWEFWG